MPAFLGRRIDFRGGVSLSPTLSARGEKEKDGRTYPSAARFNTTHAGA